MTSAGQPGALATLRPVLARFARRPGLATVAVACMAYQAAFNLALSLAGRRVFDDVLPRRDAALLGVLAAAMGAALAVRIGVVVLQERAMARLSVHVMTDVRTQMFGRLHELSPRYFAGKAAGDTLARFSSDLAIVEGAVTRLVPRAAYLSLNIAACGALMFALDWRLAAAIAGALLLTLIVPRRLGTRTARANAVRREADAGLLADVQENLALQSVVRLFGLRRWANDRHRARVEKFGQAAERAVHSAAMVEASTVLAFSAIQLLVLVAGAYFAIRGDISAGVLVAFTALVGTVAASMFGVSQVVPALIEAGAGMKRVLELLEAEAGRADGASLSRLGRLRRGIAFDDVAFSYTGARRDLDGVSLEIAAGTSVALVGPSGSGKSTLLSLLMRQWAPESGALRFDGVDVKGTTEESLFEQMAVVPQESLLFDIPVRENIRLGRLGATDDEVEQAARKAEVHDVILRMASGYDTPAGERGAKLSGGQRQRIAIARAILRDPALLLLDEATSALDAATEAAINRTLETIRRGRTVVSVTHRLGSVTDYDCICVMDGGRLVEKGTHAELLARPGVYRDLWEKQHAVSVNEDGTEASVAPQYLARVAAFASLGEAELAAIGRQFATMRFNEDHVLFRAGDPGDAFYVVARGSVVVEVPQGAGTRSRVCTEGDFFGEIALLGDRPRTATVRTQGVTTLLVLARQHFDRLVRDRPEIRGALEKVAAEHLAADA